MGLPDAKRGEKTSRQDTAERLEGLPPWHGTRQDASGVIDQMAPRVILPYVVIFHRPQYRI
jgi:hypothetical protein